MRKRGAGNIEFILAFVLFVSFTASAIYFFNPTKNVQNLESARGYVANVLVENVSAELESYSVAIQTSEKNVRVSIPDISSDRGARVVNYSGGEISSERDGSNVCFERDQEVFVTIYFSEDINVTEGSCSGSASYVIASSINEEVISEKRVSQLKRDYDADYASTAKHFNIPAGMDFSFSLEFQNGETITAKKASPLRREIFSGTEIKEILRSDGSLTFGYLTVNVW